MSRVSKLDDMILWDFCASVIHVLQSYKDLLKWCDCVDAIRQTPSTDIVPFPNHSDDISSNAPLPNNADNDHTCLSHNDMNSTPVSFNKQQS
ncbi:MAG: hypothetical protein MJE68_12455, partial [Proteobacteria bacterium]|nr:hypothetical protein [Pseudomonadota bacterium]